MTLSRVCSSILAAIATVAAAALLDPAAAADVLTIKLASLIPSGSVWDRTLETMGGEWQEATDGRIRLRIYPGGVAGDDPDLIRKLRIGQLQAATVTITGLTEIDPAFAVFEIPMFFASYEEFFRVLEDLEPELERKLEAKGFHLLHWGHAGWVYFFTTRRVETLADFRDLRVFVWAGNDRMTALWRDEGFRPIPLAATDILSGLKTGMFDALPSTPIAALSLQWFRSAPYMLDLGVTPLLGATLMTDRAWNQIENADRTAILAAAERAGSLFRREIPHQDLKAVDEMRARGLDVVPIVGTPAEVPWRSAAESFASGMRDAFVPDEMYELALSSRSAFRSEQPDQAEP